MNKTERLLGLMGAVVAILEFINSYVLKSPIRLPAQVPTAVLFGIALLFGVLVLVLSARNSEEVSKADSFKEEARKLRQDLDHTELERQQLEKDLLLAQARSSKLEQQVRLSDGSERDQIKDVERIKKQIVALLAAHSRSELELQNALGGSAETLRVALGEMVNGLVIRRRFDRFDHYELCEIRPNP